MSGRRLTNFAQIMTLYAQRPIVEKQSKYAFYHPFAEAIGKPKIRDCSICLQLTR